MYLWSKTGIAWNKFFHLSAMKLPHQSFEMSSIIRRVSDVFLNSVRGKSQYPMSITPRHWWELYYHHRQDIWDETPAASPACRLQIIPVVNKDSWDKKLTISIKMQLISNKRRSLFGRSFFLFFLPTNKVRLEVFLNRVVLSQCQMLGMHCGEASGH